MAREFGELLRRMRTRANLTLGQLARALEVSTPYLSDVELGRRKPLTRERIDQAAEVLRLDDFGRQKLVRAAAKCRGYFELEVGSASGVKLEFGAALARKWSGLDEGRVRKMLKALEEGDE